MCHLTRGRTTIWSPCHGLQFICPWAIAHETLPRSEHTLTESTREKLREREASAPVDTYTYKQKHTNTNTYIPPSPGPLWESQGEEEGPVLLTLRAVLLRLRGTLGINLICFLVFVDFRVFLLWGSSEHSPLSSAELCTGGGIRLGKLAPPFISPPPKGGSETVDPTKNKLDSIWRPHPQTGSKPPGSPEGPPRCVPYGMRIACCAPHAEWQGRTQNIRMPYATGKIAYARMHASTHTHTIYEYMHTIYEYMHT